MHKNKKLDSLYVQDPDQGNPVEMNEPLPENIFQVNSDRIKDFEKGECIGERHVNVKALKERSALFGTLFDQAGLAPICNFPESSGLRI